MAGNNKMIGDEQALKEFLLDIDCLEPLADWTGRFNLFDILKISRTEIRHSNVLAWLLNPNENHGFSDGIIRGLIQHVVHSSEEEIDIFEILMMDCHDFIIQREWRNIDILAISMEDKFLLCIENKIDSGEGNDQLNKYYSILEESYPDYKKMYIFLTPDGYESSQPEYWCPMGYQDILEIIEKNRKKVKLLPTAELLIDNYVETLRREIVGDEKLIQICSEIYAKHQKALDLIFEYKPDRTSEVTQILRQWANEKSEKGELEVVPDKCVKTYTRFKTKNMSEILPDAEEALSGWNTKNHYFYEIYNNRGNEFVIQLALSANNIPDDLKAMCERINEHYPSKQQKENWKWRIVFKTKKSKIEDEISDEKIFDQLNRMFKEVQAFEERLKVLLGFTNN